ncbi:ComEA family DNA-binding protein [Psychroflexus maritimus]|uniref:Helix-hairpin-helix domain-containing protein n=1 Tax=Psychroflexus maritimus TaxID=2714865 RepID=A0A967ADY8_9FLAO|nr:helix-hairpin-helix domain-containing protein [Psychroflexus maritimus]NGZ88711.1 helix-hairpin-helix domain-containing protein [Psychroflexus maritimus]
MKKSRAPKYWLDLNKSQQKGILVLLFLMIAAISYYAFVQLNPESKSYNQVKVDAKLNALQKKIDSLHQIKEEEANKPKIYPFNPNFLTDFRGYQLGMTTEEIDRLIDYRATNQWVNSAKEFQQVTKVSDSLLKKIEIYFKFPDFVKRKNTQQNTKKSSATFVKKDINKATIDELTAVKGIGDVLGKRIIYQRNQLGEFIDLIQLKDVWGLKYEVRQELEKRYFANPPEGFKKLELNKVSVIELSELPYFNYELAREVINFRQLNEGISTFDDLAKIQDFPYHKIDRIKLYLVINK